METDGFSNKEEGGRGQREPMLTAWTFLSISFSPPLSLRRRRGEARDKVVSHWML